MKLNKLFALLAVVAMISFASCGDDDGDCVNCEFDVLGLTTTTEACDQGDGTLLVTTTVLGVSETDTVTGTLADFQSGLEQGGFTCN